MKHEPMDDSKKVKLPQGDDGLGLEAQAQALAAEQTALLEGGSVPVSYTHLTLPTNREV